MTKNEVFSLIEDGGFMLDSVDSHGVRTYCKQADQNRYKIKVSEFDIDVYGFVSNPEMGTSSYVCPVELFMSHDTAWLMRKLREKLYDNCRYYK